MKNLIVFLVGFCVLGLLPTTPALAQAATDVNCDGCVHSGDIAKNGVRRSNIQKFSINTVKLSNFAVTSAKIKNAAVTNAKLAPEVRNQIAALSERVDALEAANVGFDGGDLDGNIYCAHGFGRELVGGAAPGVYIAHYGGVLTFISSTQVSVLDFGENEAFLNTNTGINGTATEPGGSSTMHSYFVTGNTLSIPTLLDPGFSLVISPDGNFLFGAVSNIEDAGTVHDSNWVMAVRADGC